MSCCFVQIIKHFQKYLKYDNNTMVLLYRRNSNTLDCKCLHFLGIRKPENPIIYLIYSLILNTDKSIYIIFSNYKHSVPADNIEVSFYWDWDYKWTND